MTSCSYLFAGGDITGIGQDKTAEFVEILNCSPTFLRWLKEGKLHHMEFKRGISKGIYPGIRNLGRRERGRGRREEGWIVILGCKDKGNLT